MHPTPIQILPNKILHFCEISEFQIVWFFRTFLIDFCFEFQPFSESRWDKIEFLSNQSWTDTSSRPSPFPDPCPPNSATTICSNRTWIWILKFFFRIPFAKAANNSHGISNIPITIWPRMCWRRIDNWKTSFEIDERFDSIGSLKTNNIRRAFNGWSYYKIYHYPR